MAECDLGGAAHQTFSGRLAKGVSRPKQGQRVSTSTLHWVQILNYICRQPTVLVPISSEQTFWPATLDLLASLDNYHELQSLFTSCQSDSISIQRSMLP